MSRTCCIIPVRGGSKGLPGKNLMEFSGISLLEWTIRQALEVYAPEDIFVTSDDKEMLNIAQKCGVQAIQRPAELAQDDSTSASAVAHTLSQTSSPYSRLCLLQVTSPLRTAEDIERAEAMMQSDEYDSVVSAYRDDEASPGKLYRMQGDKAVSIAPDLAFMRRQEQPAIFRRNSALYACTLALFEETGQLWGGKVGLVEMPKERSVDIDSLEDLEQARAALKAL